MDHSKVVLGANENSRLANIDAALESGLILVFDLDDTIVSAKYPSGRELDISFPSPGSRELWEAECFNPNIMRLLTKAHAARATGKVEAIFLLSNNSSESYAGLVNSILATKIGRSSHRPGFFDGGMLRTSPGRETEQEWSERSDPLYSRYVPGKFLRDVLMMYRNLAGKKNVRSIEPYRVYFFDDIQTHKIGDEIPRTNYIKIQYKDKSGSIIDGYKCSLTDDATDYSGLPLWLNPGLEGGFRHHKQKKSRKMKMKMKMKMKRKTKTKTRTNRKTKTRRRKSLNNHRNLRG